jgi:hypothetical protein
MSKSTPTRRSEGIFSSESKSLRCKSYNILIFIFVFILFILSQQLNVTINEVHVSSDAKTQVQEMSRATKSNSQNDCSFAKPYSTAPIPLILMSMGRSGSSVTWNTLSTMLGSTTTAYEVTGGNRTKSANFFNSIKPDNLDWAVKRLCKIQRRHIRNENNAVITGFQWKPYKVTLDHPMGKATLESIAKHTEPQIKVLHLTRNPLDRLISNLRHKGHIRSDEIPAHCAIDDEECVKRHKAMSKNVTLPTNRKLIETIRQSIHIDQLTRDLLSMYRINNLSVTYEKLYNGSEDVREWKRIFDFLGRTPKNVANYKNALTRRHVEDAFAIAPTSVKSHRMIISNYDEVEEALVNAGFGHLLH